MKIKKGDKVIVVTGKDKGKTGVVERVLIKENRIVVEGLNTKKRHTKAGKKSEKGQILEIAMPFDATNVMLIDPKTKKQTRIGYQIGKDGKKVRVAKKSGTNI